jgi:uncharacterized protein (TIGR00251 family)
MKNKEIINHIRVKVLPRSSRDEIVAKQEDYYKVRLTSPPVEGKANKALVELLAKKLHIPKSHVEIASGKSSRLKSVKILGLSPERIHSLLLG